MKTIKIDKYTGEIVSTQKIGNTLYLRFSTIDTAKFVTALQSGKNICIYDGAELCEEYEGYDNFDSIIKDGNAIVAELKKSHTFSERVETLEAQNAVLMSENDVLTGELTATQLALAELSETLFATVDNAEGGTEE